MSENRNLLADEDAIRVAAESDAAQAEADKRGLRAPWRAVVGQDPDPSTLDTLLGDDWTPDQVRLVLSYAQHAVARGEACWLVPRSDSPDVLMLIANRLVAMTRRLRGFLVPLDTDRLLDWFMLAVAAPRQPAWNHVDVMLLGGADGDGDVDFHEWHQIPVGLAPLAWAAGLDPDEMLARMRAGETDVEGLRTLGALRGWVLPAPAGAAT